MGIFFNKQQANDSTLSEDTVDAKKAAKGNLQSFEKLVKKYERFVVSCVYPIVKNPEDAKDISQETFLKAYKSLSTFKGESEFSTWLYKIAKNCALDFVRKQKIISLSSDSSGEDGEGFDIPDRSEKTNPEKSALQKEKNEILYSAILLLSDEHREIIILRDINGYSYEQISQMLSIEQGTVKSRIFRAREALKKILLKKNYF